jgi:hypothetical protein
MILKRENRSIGRLTYPIATHGLLGIETGRSWWDAGDWPLELRQGWIIIRRNCFLNFVHSLVSKWTHVFGNLNYLRLRYKGVEVRCKLNSIKKDYFFSMDLSLSPIFALSIMICECDAICYDSITVRRWGVYRDRKMTPLTLLRK